MSTYGSFQVSICNVIVQSSEDYSYFHLVPSGPKPTTVFGISYVHSLSWILPLTCFAS